MLVRSVVVLNDFCHVQGGASRVAIDEALSLQSAGLDVTFLGAAGPVCHELLASRVRTICLQQPELLAARRHPAVLLQALWNHRAYTQAQSLLSSLNRRNTIVHLHGYTKALTAAPALAAKRAGFSVVCTLHDFFAACPNGAFFDYREGRPCHREALSTACIMHNCDKRHPGHKAFRVARGLAQRHISAFPASVRDYISLSRQSANLLRSYMPTEARLYPLANIIDVPQAPPVNVAANSQLMVVGRLDIEKGVLLAMRAAKQAGLAITFVGDGPLRGELEAAGAKVTGWVSAPEVHAMLDQARCLIFPSLWYETYGLVVDEAAARGVPAIVSDISAPADRVLDGVTGWIFPSGDDDSLRCSMMRLRDNACVAARGQAAYQHYWANPADPRRHTLDLLAIYEAVISRNPAACSALSLGAAA